MEENISNPSTSPYMFRPILEPSTINDESATRSYISQTSTQPSSTPYQADRLSVIDRSCSSRIRVSSGGPSSSSLDIANFRSHPVSSPSVALGGCAEGSLQKRPPKLYNCWRTNPESWSSTGSRHSSRPGSSQASSRPPSQCTGRSEVQQQQGQQHASSQLPNAVLSSNLYSKSNNNSNSDVSAAQKNFQKLSVSSRINAECRRAAFKSQKWSNSFDQTCVAASSPSSVGTTSQASPGRNKRQSSLQQAPQSHQQRSLDLPDSGYSGASSVDLGKSWYSQSSWDPTSQINSTHQQQQLAVGNAQLLKQFSNASSTICVSPIETAKQELEELKSEFGDVFASNIITTSTGMCGISSSIRNTIVHQNISQEEVTKEDEIAGRSASLPSFPDSFIPGIAGRNVNLNNSFNGQLQPNVQQDLRHDVGHISSMNHENMNCSNVVQIVDEPLDVLDKEIEMIMAPQEKTPTTSEVLNFLEEYEEDPLNRPFEGLDTLDERSELSSSQTRQRNPFFLKPPPLSRGNSGGSSGECENLLPSNAPASTIITVTGSQEPSPSLSRMGYLKLPNNQSFKGDNSIQGGHWPYTNKNNKRSLFARKNQQRASFNNDESSPQTRPPSLKAFHHSIDEDVGLSQYNQGTQQRNANLKSLQSEAPHHSVILEPSSITSIRTSSVSSSPSAASVEAVSLSGNTSQGNAISIYI